MHLLPAASFHNLPVTVLRWSDGTRATRVGWLLHEDLADHYGHRRASQATVRWSTVADERALPGRLEVGAYPLDGDPAIWRDPLNTTARAVAGLRPRAEATPQWKLERLYTYGWDEVTDDNPERFPTKAEATKALADHLATCRAAIAAGHLQGPVDRLRVVKEVR